MIGRQERCWHVTAAVTALLACLLAIAAPVLAQGPPGGSSDRDRGGFFDRGGDRGGDDRFRGPPGGPFGGPPGGFNPEDMIRRLDANGNGVIEPQEAEGRARYMVERIARDNGLDPSRPIPVNRLIEAMRSRGDRGPSGDSRGSDSRAAAVAPAPLVPGFGVELVLTPVPGFGTPLDNPTLAELAKKYDSRIIERVDESIRRYDRNGNGVLDADEWEGIRWSTNPRDADKNKDGKLTREEIAQRYVERYGSELSGSSSSSSRSGDSGSSFRPIAVSTTVSPAPPPVAASSSGSSSSRGSSSSGTSSGSDSQIATYADSLLRQYDSNGDGRLQKEEWSRMAGDPQASDRNGDGIITREELIERLSSYSRSRPGSSSSSGPSRTTSSLASAESDKRSYRFLSPTERLPEGLPTWFTRNDTNGDGQITMAEYTTTWTDEKAAEFARYDLNGDGIITPKECLAVEKK